MCGPFRNVAVSLRKIRSHGMCRRVLSALLRNTFVHFSSKDDSRLSKSFRSVVVFILVRLRYEEHHKSGISSGRGLLRPRSTIRISRAIRSAAAENQWSRPMEWPLFRCGLLEPRFTFWFSRAIRSAAGGNQWSRPATSVQDRVHWSVPLFFCSKWSDRTTESERGSESLQEHRA